MLESSGMYANRHEKSPGKEPGIVLRGDLTHVYLSAYSLPSKGCCQMLHAVLTAAETNKCWVYDLHSSLPDAPDFKVFVHACVRERE